MIRGRRRGGAVHPAAELGDHNKLFHELRLYKCVCCKVNVCVFEGGVQRSDGRWKDGMCAKEGIKGMFF